MIILIIAGILVVAGAAVFVFVMSVNGWDFKKLGTGKYHTSSYVVKENFDEIVINTKEADVQLLPSEDGKCTVICYEEDELPHEVKVESDKLLVDVKDNRAWYDYINFSFGTPKITVYLPEDKITSLTVNGSTGDVDVPNGLAFKNIAVSSSTGAVSCSADASGTVKIELSTGEINLVGLKAGQLDLTTSTGKINVKMVDCDGDITVNVSTGSTRFNAVECKNLYSKGSTGDIELNGVTATGKFNIERNTGDVELENCDAGEIFIKTSTGDIEGSLLSDKIFFTHTSTGEIDVPRTTTGGTCELSTSTGDIKIEIK